MDQDDLLVIRAPSSTALNPTLDHRPRASGGAKIYDRLSTGTAALRKYRSFADGLPNGSYRLKAEVARDSPAPGSSACNSPRACLDRGTARHRHAPVCKGREWRRPSGTPALLSKPRVSHRRAQL